MIKGPKPCFPKQLLILDKDQESQYQDPPFENKVSPKCKHGHPKSCFNILNSVQRTEQLLRFTAHTPVVLEKSIITKKKAEIYNGLSVQTPENLPQSYQADKHTN